MSDDHTPPPQSQSPPSPLPPQSQTPPPPTQSPPSQSPQPQSTPPQSPPPSQAPHISISTCDTTTTSTSPPVSRCSDTSPSHHQLLATHDCQHQPQSDSEPHIMKLPLDVFGLIMDLIGSKSNILGFTCRTLWDSFHLRCVRLEVGYHKFRQRNGSEYLLPSNRIDFSTTRQLILSFEPSSADEKGVAKDKGLKKLLTGFLRTSPKSSPTAAAAAAAAVPAERGGGGGEQEVETQQFRELSRLCITFGRDSATEDSITTRHGVMYRKSADVENTAVQAMHDHCLSWVVATLFMPNLWSLRALRIIDERYDMITDAQFQLSVRDTICQMKKLEYLGLTFSRNIVTLRDISQLLKPLTELRQFELILGRLPDVCHGEQDGLKQIFDGLTGKTRLWGLTLAFQFEGQNCSGFSDEDMCVFHNIAQILPSLTVLCMMFGWAQRNCAITKNGLRQLWDGTKQLLPQLQSLDIKSSRLQLGDENWKHLCEMFDRETPLPLKSLYLQPAKANITDGRICLNSRALPNLEKLSVNLKHNPEVQTFQLGDGNSRFLALKLLQLKSAAVTVPVLRSFGKVCPNLQTIQLSVLGEAKSDVPVDSFLILADNHKLLTGISLHMDPVPIQPAYPFGFCLEGVRTKLTHLKFHTTRSVQHITAYTECTHVEHLTHLIEASPLLISIDLIITASPTHTVCSTFVEAVKKLAHLERLSLSVFYGSEKHQTKCCDVFRELKKKELVATTQCYTPSMGTAATQNSPSAQGSPPASPVMAVMNKDGLHQYKVVLSHDIVKKR